MPQTLSFDFILTPQGVRQNARLSVDDNGFIAAIEDAGEESREGYFALPGMPNAHSHCFQRALAGFGERNLGADSFWDWREYMYRLANRVTPEDMYIIARQAFTEMLCAGFTAVGEFHYLHHLPDGSASRDMSEAVIRAAAHVGIRLVMLPVLYMRGGFNASLQDSQKRFAHADLDSYLRMVDELGPVPRGLAGTCWATMCPFISIFPNSSERSTSAWNTMEPARFMFWRERWIWISTGILYTLPMRISWS
jgi:formimidoylglutamate deiminase